MLRARFFLLTACSAFAQQRVVLTEASTKTLDQSIAEITERRKSGDLQPIVLVLPAGTYRLNQTLQVSIELAKGCRVERCRFVGLGNTAMWFGSRTVDCEVTDCMFEHIGGNGLK